MTVSAPQLGLQIADRPRIGLGIVIWLCLLSALCGRLAYLTRPFNSDASMFIYMGKVISEGGRPGHDFVDNKFPSVGLMTGVAWRAFGTNWAAYVLLQSAMMLLAVGMLARAMRRHAGENAALASGCFALVMLNFGTMVFGGFQLETIQVFFAILAAAAAASAIDDGAAADAFVVGLCAGCAAMLKPTGLSIAIAFVVALSVSRSLRLRQLYAVIAGLLVPASVVLTHLISTNTLDDVPQLVQQIARYAAGSAWQIYKIAIVGALVAFPFLVRGWIFRRDRLPDKSSRGLKIFVISWLVLEVIGVVMQRRMYAYHFLVLMPPAAMAFGLIPRITRASSLAAAFGPITILSALGAGRVVDPDYRGQQLHPVSAHLLSHANPDDAVWREDGARILLETNLKSGSRFPLTFLFTNHDQAPLEYGQQILLDFARTRPKYIVLFTNFEPWLAHQCEYYTELRLNRARRENYLKAWRAIRQYVDQHYVGEATVGEETVYRRKSAETATNDR
jgi:hypothetical protein